VSNLSFAEDIIKDSKIKNVTVFLQGAQINREARFSVKSGVTEIIVSGLSRYVDAKSIQAKGTNGIIILDTKFTSYYPSPGENEVSKLPQSIRIKIRAAEDSLERIGFELANLNSELEVLNASKSIIMNNGSMKGQGKVNDSIQLLQEAVKYYLAEVSRINKEINNINRIKANKNDLKNGLNQRLQALKNYSKNDDFKNEKNTPDYRIIVAISSKTAVSGYLDLTYLVSNAGWNAQYDLISNVEDNHINLNYKAEVYQNTGIDWKDVRLSVSTNDPNKNKTKPELSPWILQTNPYAIQQRQIQTRSDDVQALSSVSVSRQKRLNSVQSEEVQMERNFNYSTSAQHTQIVQHMISAEFKIDLPYSIKSNGEKHMVLVKNEDVDANYRYYTVPKLENSAYLVAEITNLEELQLIPAKASIFFDGTYMGETYLNPGVMDDTLSLSLGKDPNIIVKRTFMKKNYKEKIIGNDVEKTSQYQIEILNNKGKTIELIVQDQVPVSRQEGIEITVEDISKGSLNEITGLVEWKVKLKSKDKETLDLRYTVKHNKKEPIAIR
jgi:uncharacterized protein (TIGR02231 family)